MDNIIKVYFEKDNYYLEYKNIKCITYIGKNKLTNNKKEGDLKTPIGIFDLGLVFGTHNDEDLQLNKNIKYVKINDKLYWVDDINSKYYNKLIDISKIEKDFTSAEHLIKYLKAYEYGIEIKVNPNNIKGSGSAIFIHCYGNNNYTAGCIAISKENMINLLKKIDENTKINIINS